MADKYYQENWDFNDIFEYLQLGKTKDEDIKNRRLITDWLWKQYSKTKTSLTTSLLAQKEGRKECKCSCHQLNPVAFACTECQKNHPTPSPLEGFKEIDDIDWVTPAISKVELAKKFNWLNRNQKKLYQYIKSLKEKK